MSFKSQKGEFMQINNNSNVAFGTRVPQKFLDELSVSVPVKNRNSSTYLNMLRDLDTKAEHVRKFGSDTFEIGFTKDPETQKLTLCLRDAVNSDKAPVILPKNRKQVLLARFLSFKKEDIVNAQNEIKHGSTIEEITKHIIKFR